MTEPTSHADIIALWPNTAEFARAVSRQLPPDKALSESNARNMKARGAIPPAFYQAVADAAAQAGWEGITYARLTELGRAAA